MIDPQPPSKFFYDSQYIDWGGRWFSVAKHRGESDLAGLGRGILEDHLGGPVSYREDFNFSHAEMDGISAMNLQLAKLGQLTPYFPELKDKLPPTGIQKWLAIAKALKKQMSASVKWFQFEHSHGSTSPIDVVGFTEEESLHILQTLRSRGLTLDGVLLSLLDLKVRKLLADPRQPAKWLFPINMRGASAIPNIICNQVSFITLLSVPQWRPRSVQEQIKQSLDQKEHWGNWSLYSVGKYIGPKGMHFLSRRSAQKNFWLGTFSNLGSWQTDPHYQPLHPSEIWFASPPGSANYPIGFIHCLFNHKLSLSLKVHSAVGAHPSWAYDTLQSIRRHLLRMAKVAFRPGS